MLSLPCMGTYAFPFCYLDKTYCNYLIERSSSSEYTIWIKLLSVPYTFQSISFKFIQNMSSNAEALANQVESGELDDKDLAVVGGSGKNRTKNEQHEHKKPVVDDTRKIVTNALNAEQKRREEEKQKNKWAQ